MATYSLGSNDAEIARLEMQANRLREPTRILLEASGIGPGMRVLDLGTGLGDVAILLAELVGPDGQVVGLDLDPRMLEVARARTGRLPNVSFVEGDVTSWRGDGEFDAVVSRLLVLHLADPAAVVRHHLDAVRSGGVVLHIDYDTGGARAAPSVPIVEQMFALVSAALRSAGADPTVGSRLKVILADCGVADVEGLAISQYLTSDDPTGPALLSGVVHSLAPRMIAEGLATEADLELDTLTTRIAQALRSADSVLVSPTLAGAWGRRP